MAPSRVTKRQRSGFELLVSAPGREVIWLLYLAYTSMESCRVNWHAANGKTADVSTVLERPSVDVPMMDDPSILLEKNAS